MRAVQCSSSLHSVPAPLIIAASSYAGVSRVIPRPAAARTARRAQTPRIQRASTIVKAAASATDDLTTEELKAVLQDSLWGTERGLSADSDTRAEIVDLISQLEARNPTPSPTDAVDKLSGTWKLAYTSNSELMALLAVGRLPLISVGDICQIVDAEARTVENRIQLSAPFSRTELAANATFEVRSPKLLQIEFKEGQVGTPELLSDFELPASVELLGQSVDLSAVKTALQPLDGPLRSAVDQISSLLAGAPNLKFQIRSPAPSASWLLTTYLDEDLRISRGDGGSVFVLTKEAVALLPPAPPVEIAAAVPEPAATVAVAVPAVEPDAVIDEGDSASVAGNGSSGGFFDS